MSHIAASDRYLKMHYRRSGNSGLLLPAISVGLWQNFGSFDSLDKSKQILFTAFDHGITHFDLANNYGPPPGAAEENFGKIFKSDLFPYRDELIISTKAGYSMWPGPYGDWGSKKYLVASLDQSLKRMGLDYVDIFYHHRPDPHTPLEETMSALDLIVRQGKALYIGLSNYRTEESAKAISILKRMQTPLVIHQPKYSMLVRWVETGLLDLLEKEGVGCIAFSPLAQGVLTDKYLGGIPAQSRAARDLGNGAIQAAEISDEVISKARKLNELAKRRNQSLAQMSLAWVLKDPRITSVVIGVSRPEQVTDAMQSLNNLSFTEDELDGIEKILLNKPAVES
ncbi:MAG: L-glyceraldehyde 3-phosphate reductase [Chitinophagales bacterium]